MRGCNLAEPEQTHTLRLTASVSHGFVGLKPGWGFDQSKPESPPNWTRIPAVVDGLLTDWRTL
jgi:hypothetical protein